MKLLFPVKALLALALLGLLCAASWDRISMKLTPETTIWLTGSSDSYPWSCSVDKLDGALTFESTTVDKKMSVVGVPTVIVTVPVDELSCGHPQAKKDLREAMKADSYPEIRFELLSSEIEGNGESEFVIHATGRILAAGAEREVTMDVQGELLEDGRLQFRGAVPFSMSDFDINPPAQAKVTSVQEFVVNFYAMAGM